MGPTPTSSGLLPSGRTVTSGAHGPLGSASTGTSIQARLFHRRSKRAQILEPPKTAPVNYGLRAGQDVCNYFREGAASGPTKVSTRMNQKGPWTMFTFRIN